MNLETLDNISNYALTASIMSLTSSVLTFPFAIEYPAVLKYTVGLAAASMLLAGVSIFANNKLENYCRGKR